ncbi:type IV pilus assembly protein PilC [Polynucleobacter meluiroseus]|uniref:Type IV pilus assembly protein PilC n=2 Tax=Polynucleobacter meluiroseus TaxID=1938814 RepID=A0A240E388_9BURK|nr:type II secretion system F family protein [Polynucleobacter meluiroseus]SNX28981.1 type IV pilus assembly protein PilC [Polynucleobacter meluiroseus]
MAFLKSFLPSRSLSAVEQLHFSQQLLSLMRAGLPLMNALNLLTQSAPNSWQPWLLSLLDLLKKGYGFSYCLSASQNQFSAEVINLIRVSERTGDLISALRTICQQLEAQIEMKRKIQQALAYPLITLSTSFLLVIVMMLWVVPVFKEVFSQFQAELPTPTKILIAFSTMIEHWFLEMLMIMVISFGLFIVVWTKSNQLQKRCDRFSLRIPILGNLLRMATLTHWCRTLGHLLHSGLALPDALRVTAQSSNHWLSHDFSAEIFKQLTRGWPFGEALIRVDPAHQLFDIETLQLLSIGSESGTLPDMLCKRADILGSQLSNQLNTLSQTLEPLLILLVGMIIGSIVIILYLPIFNLGQIV